MSFGEVQDFFKRSLASIQAFQFGSDKHDLWLDVCQGCCLCDQVEIGAHSGVVLVPRHLLRLEVGAVKADKEES